MPRRSTEPRPACPPWRFLLGLALGACALAGCAQPPGPRLAEEHAIIGECAARVQELQARLDALLRALAAGEEALAQVQAAHREALETARARARETETALRHELAEAQRLAAQRAAAVKELEAARASLEKEVARGKDEAARFQKQIAILQATHRLELKKLADRIKELEGGRQNRE